MQYLKWVILFLVVLVLLARFGSYALGSTIAKLLIFIALYCMATSAYSGDAQESVMKAAALLLVFGGVSLYFGPFVFSGDDSFRTLIDRLGWGFVVMASIYFVPSIALYLAGINHPPFMASPLFTGLEEGWSVRFCGIMGNPNQLGICAAIYTPVVFAKAFEAPTRRWFCWFVFACICVSVWISGSRNGFLSLVIGCSVCFIFSSPSRNILGRGLVIVLVGVCAVSLTSDSLISYFSRDKATEINVEKISENRMSRWTAGLESIKKRPVIGQGYSHGGVPKSGYVDPFLSDTGYPLHNSYLQTTQELGLAGLMFVMTPLAICCSMLFDKRNSALAISGLRISYAGFAGVLSAGMFNAVFESWIIAPGNLGTFPFWCAVALIYSMPSRRIINHFRLVQAPT